MQKLKQKQTKNGLFLAAKRYKNSGFSIIPVHAGSSQNAKAASAAWKKFQKHQPTIDEITEWFSSENPDRGIAIICGSVSKLIVLDIDDLSIFRDLNHGMAYLLQTYIVRTPGRKGLHIYWRVNFPVASQKVRGGDLQAEGKYVVAPPTTIDSQPYEAINDLPIKTLTREDLQQILDFLSALPQPNYSPVQTVNKTCSTSTNEQTLSDFYYQISHEAGRNNALFAAARKARNQHWSLAETIIYLTPIHAAQITKHSHRRENIHQRRREALRTIASAFSRPPLEEYTPPQNENPGLPNTVREALLQTQTATTQQSCAAARVLDALRMAGWRTGKIFTAREALTVCRVFKIGRDSLLKALTAVGKWGKKLIPKSLMLSRASAPDKNPVDAKLPPPKAAAGRPLQRYEMPDNAYLIQAVGVSENTPQDSDPLQPADLASPMAYRAAIERELLKRRPGQYPNGWLARRLGISRRTIQRYHKQLGVRIQPVYGYTPYAENLLFRDFESRKLQHSRSPQPANSLLFRDLNHGMGTWLQDQSGKRYPPIAALAAKLQKRGHIVTYVRQQPNYYALSPESIENQLPAAGSVPASERTPLRHKTPAADQKTQNGNGKIAQMFCYWRCLRCGSLIPGQPERAPSHCEACALGAPALSERAARTQEATTSELLARLRSGISSQQTLTPTLVSTTLTWRNLHDIVPPEDYAPETGAWLQDPSGKRYPPIRGLAMRLLKRFGVGNVRYFSHDESAAVFHDLGLWLAREGQYEGAMRFFRRAGLNAVDADAGQ